MRYFFIIAVLLCSGCATQGNWSSGDTWRQVGVTAIIAADAYTTAKIHTRPDLEEGNDLVAAVIGRNPEPNDVYIFYSTMAVSNYVIGRYIIPEKYRKYWQFGSIAYHGVYLINNCNKDLC